MVTDPKIASNVLKWAVTEMERRIRKLASEGVRNIEQYNNIIRGERAPAAEGAEELKPLHYIVIIIDELADLMMVSSHEVEEAITRLAQMARAVGIHLILATQRPSVDVLTGLIKANFPSRISFRVAARVDSRTILDSIGAEHLLGKGDMLFLPPGSARLTRIHGCFVSEKEIARLTSYLRKAGKPAFDETVGKTERTTEAAEAEDRDELFDEAVRFCVQSKQASTSMLQRRFRIGFSRAGRLVDMMERDGIVGPADGSKSREILVADGLLRDGGRLAQVKRGAVRRLLAALLAATMAAPAPALADASPKKRPRAASTPDPRPDAVLYQEAQQGLATLKASSARQARKPEWEKVVMQFRRVVARYPQSGYCDNALLTIGDLYREMARRFEPRYAGRRRAGLSPAGGRVPEQQPGREGALQRARDRAPGRRPQGDRRRRPRVPRRLPRLAARGRGQGGDEEGRRAPRRRRCPRRRRAAWPRSSTCASGAARARRASCSTSRRPSTTSTTASATPTACGWTSRGRASIRTSWARIFPVGDGLLEKIRVGQNKDSVGARRPRLQGREGPHDLLPGEPDAPGGGRARDGGAARRP